MRYEFLIPIVVAIITSVIGPLLLFFLNRKYTDKKIDQFDARIKEQFDEVILGNYTFALNKLDETIRNYIKDRHDDTNLRLELKLIAVAMTYSWEFITEELPKILDDHPKLYIDLKIAFVDSNHLRELNRIIDSKEKDWAAISEEKTKKVPDYRNTMRRYGNRFSCDFRTYANLPHWHGWLVSEKDNGTEHIKYLLLGRTKWEYSFKDGTLRKKPKLTVGQNEYRFFTTNVDQGKSRVDIFEQWHKFYFEKNYCAKISTTIK